MAGKSNELSLKEALQQMVDQLRWKPKLYGVRIEKIWQTSMGPVINSHTRELKVRGRKLFVTIDSAPLKQELSMGRHKILQMMNEGLGEEYLVEVVVR